jgi:histone H3/H4
MWTMAKKTAKKSSKKAKKSLEMMVVASKAKEYIKQQDCRTSADALATANEKLACMLDAAVARAKANKRQTVQQQDV